MARLFIAIDLPEDVRQNLAQICFGVPGAKWVTTEQMHLTLNFIGEANGNTFLDLQEALAEVNSPPFELIFKGVGHFPPRGHARVLWAGIDKEPLLNELKNKIDRLL